jgi:hypothetical protein
MSDPEHISGGLAESLESLRRTIEANPGKAAPESKRPPPATATVIQLPLWPESRRAAPNAVFRSALFPALSFREGRGFLKNHAIASVGGVTAFFTGERFDQSDLDVYLELLNLARLHPLGTECAFSAYGMLKLLGRQTGNTDHKWLHAVLIRLCGGVVDITDHKKRYFGSLIEGGFKDEITKHYRVLVNPKFAAMFGYGMWSSLDREQRHALGRNATAKALHAYYATHVTPGPHKFDTLAAIVGLNNPNKRQQRATLIKAHALLASDRIAFLTGYEPQGDTITAYLQPTPGQARHIAKQAIKSRRARSRPSTG